MSGCHHGVIETIPSRLADEGYPPRQKCLDCGEIRQMIWGPWKKKVPMKTRTINTYGSKGEDEYPGKDVGF